MRLFESVPGSLPCHLEKRNVAEDGSRVGPGEARTLLSAPQSRQDFLKRFNLLEGDSGTTCFSASRLQKSLARQEGGAEHLRVEPSTFRHSYPCGPQLQDVCCHKIGITGYIV